MELALHSAYIWLRSTQSTASTRNLILAMKRSCSETQHRRSMPGFVIRYRCMHWWLMAMHRPLPCHANSQPVAQDYKAQDITEEQGRSELHTLDLLEWPRLCSYIAKFASTSIGREELLKLKVTQPGLSCLACRSLNAVRELSVNSQEFRAWRSWVSAPMTELT